MDFQILDKRAEGILAHMREHDKEFLYGFLMMYAGIQNIAQRDFALVRLIELVEELEAMARRGV